MYVCVCKGIKATQIQEAMVRGCTSVEALSAELGLGMGCGTCLEFAQQFIDRRLRERAGKLAYPAVSLS